MTQQLLAIAIVGKTHGTRGELRLHLLHESDSLLQVGASFLIDNGRRTLTIESLRSASQHYLVQFKGFNSREDAAHLTNQRLLVDRSDLPPTDPDEFYCADLVGFSVFAPDPFGESSSLLCIGEVTGFLDRVQTDVMLVDGDRLASRWLVPFLKEVVVTVDLQKRCVILAPLKQWTHEDQVLLPPAD